MHAQATAPPRDGVVIASGYGLKIHVQAGHLVVHDGVGTRRQTRRYNRATGGVRRLVVLGHDGYVTLDALHWVRETGAAYLQLDHDGRIVAQSTVPGSDIARLRRSQAQAATAPVGVEVARLLLSDKVDGQATIAEQIAGTADPEIAQAREVIRSAQTMDELLAGESAAAGVYWKTWSGLTLPFPAGQARRLPEHWLTFGQRHSPLTRSTRLAANPANAILNYLYALLEVETTLALQTIGLDPGLGLFHADKPGRASMSLDVMEACRPVVDAYLLALLTDRTLSARDFVETPRGGCRLRPAFAKELAETTAVWGNHAAPVAERVAQLLAHAVDEPIPTNLTEGERAAAWSSRRAAPKKRATKTARLPDLCRDCGGQLPNRRHRYCPDCREQRWGKASENGRETAATVLRQLREAGHDPAHGGRAAEIRGRKNAAHQAAVRDWNQANEGTPDREAYAAIVPALRHISIETLEDATGLSAHYCSLIRLGKRTPHARHWPALIAVADTVT